MAEALKQLKEEVLQAVQSAEAPDVLEALRVEYLGKKGRVTAQMRDLGRMDPEARKEAGQALNLVKQEIADVIAARREVLEAVVLNARLAEERVDVSLPVRAETVGSIHPIAQVIEEVISIFAQMGFIVASGPEVEDEDHNFNALNIPENHPARQMHDTFYLEPEGEVASLLRTHTSSVQIRYARDHQPPMRIIAPGRTYRCDSDITHSPMFHQVEGLCIDKDIHMGHLKGCLTNFIEQFFGLSDVPVRFRPSFFPFTEPSAEMDIGCVRERGRLQIGGSKDDKQGWMEILGCGMVHPNVLTAMGIDPMEYQGFAFGVGVERLAMLKYGMPDLRAFFDSDVRWLEHYGFAPEDVPNMVKGVV